VVVGGGRVGPFPWDRERVFADYFLCVVGEDALANLSVEKEGEHGPVTGFMRIRSRSQGLALSLGSLKGLSKIGEMV
jgi:coatomer subunit beta